MSGPTILVERKEIILASSAAAPEVVTERRDIVLTQVPGVGPPGSIEGGFSVNGAPPFDMSGSIEGLGGILVAAQGLRRYYMHRPGTIAFVTFSAALAPQGQSAVFDVNKNGTSLWTLEVNKPAIAPGFNVSLNVVPDIPNFLAGDYFTVDCDQTGLPAPAGSPGGYVTFSIWYF